MKMPLELREIDSQLMEVTKSLSEKYGNFVAFAYKVKSHPRSDGSFLEIKASPRKDPLELSSVLDIMNLPLRVVEDFPNQHRMVSSDYFGVEMSYVIHSLKGKEIPIHLLVVLGNPQGLEGESISQQREALDTLGEELLRRGEVNLE